MSTKGMKTGQIVLTIIILTLSIAFFIGGFIVEQPGIVLVSGMVVLLSGAILFHNKGKRGP